VADECNNFILKFQEKITSTVGYLILLLFVIFY